MVLAREPPHLTGLDEAVTPFSELPVTFNAVHDHFASVIRDDPEMLYAVGLMAHLFPYLLGDEDVWTRRSAEYARHLRASATRFTLDL